MSIRPSTLGVTLAATAVVAGCAVTLPAVASTPAARHEGRGALCSHKFDRAVAAYVDTTDRRDSAGFERLLDEDYTVILPGGTTFAGKAAGSAFIDKFFARTDFTQTFHVTREVAQGCSSALVVFDSTYTDSDGAVPLVIGVSWTFTHGKWLAVQDQNTVVDG